jgi:hypothetical protein
MLVGAMLFGAALTNAASEATGCSSAQRQVEVKSVAGIVTCVAQQLASGASDESTAINCGLQAIEDIPAIVAASKQLADVPRASDD